MALGRWTPIRGTIFSAGSFVSWVFRGGLAALLNDLGGLCNACAQAVDDGTFDELHVGTGPLPGYPAASDSYLEVDGGEPPTMNRIRIWDYDLGAWYYAELRNGVWVFTAA